MADTEEKKNKPEDSDFKQQRLKAWQPILTPFWVIVTFASVGVVFLIIGILVLVASNDVVEFTSSSYETSLPSTCTPAVAPCPCSSANGSSCIIEQTITIDKDMNSPIYMYYQLENFYQNHRRYVKSRSDVQLRNSDLFDTSGSCEPLAKRNCGTAPNAGECAVYPCGLIAWSVFNDTFYGWDPRGTTPTSGISGCVNSDNQQDPTACLKVTRDNTPQYFPWTSSGIAWKSDIDKKFISPSTVQTVGTMAAGTTPSDSNTVALPYDTYKYFKCTETQYFGQNLSACPTEYRYADVANEEFIVWMRTSGLPDFRKLHRIINTDLKQGDTITFYVNNAFPVTAFDGKKKIVLSTTTWIGGKNQFLGWAYIVVAILCLLLAIGFGIKQWVSPREPTTSSELEKTLNEPDA
jgi:hypothetical protein